MKTKKLLCLFIILFSLAAFADNGGGHAGSQKEYIPLSDRMTRIEISSTKILILECLMSFEGAACNQLNTDGYCEYDTIYSLASEISSLDYINDDDRNNLYVAGEIASLLHWRDTYAMFVDGQPSDDGLVALCNLNSSY